MKGVAIILAVLGLGQACRAAEATAQSEPVWRLRPSDYAIGNDNYPAAAQRAQAAGRASLRCIIGVGGWLRDCSVRDESPSGLGFGDKAIWIAREFRAKPTAPDGASMQGRPATVTIDFTPRHMFRVAGPEAGDGGPGPPQLVRSIRPPDARYPWEARQTDVAGRVVLRCRAKANGDLSDCEAAREIPEGLGFGRMAVLASKHFRVERKTLDGAPIEGRVVEVPVVLNPSCADLSATEARTSGCRTP